MKHKFVIAALLGLISADDMLTQTETDNKLDTDQQLKEGASMFEDGSLEEMNNTQIEQEEEVNIPDDTFVEPELPSTELLEKD